MNLAKPGSDVWANMHDMAECVLDAMYSDGAKTIYESRSEDFKIGALWGMSWAVSNIWAHCPRYKIKEQEDEI